MTDEKDFADVLPGVEAQHSDGAAGVDEAEAFVLAESLGVHIEDAGGDADDIDALHFGIRAGGAAVGVGGIGRVGVVGGRGIRRGQVGGGRRRRRYMKVGLVRGRGGRSDDPERKSLVHWATPDIFRLICGCKIYNNA